MPKITGWIPGFGYVEAEISNKELEESNAELERAARRLSAYIADQKPKQKEPTQ